MVVESIDYNNNQFEENKKHAKVRAKSTYLRWKRKSERAGTRKKNFYADRTFQER